MKKPTSQEIARQVDAKSNELIAEFRPHKEEIIAKNPTDLKLIDERIIFESWAIQKIAGLHDVIEGPAREIRGVKKARR